MRARRERPVVRLIEDEAPVELDRCDSRTFFHDIVAPSGDPAVPSAGR